jgi:hypothetical protein
MQPLKKKRFGAHTPIPFVNLAMTKRFKQEQKLITKLLGLQQKRYQQMTREKSTPRDFRRARTRTLLQIGGLLQKAGLLQDFGIELGADLQKDLEMQKPVAALYWGLLELKAMVRSEDFNLTLWTAKGQKALSEP